MASCQHCTTDHDALLRLRGTETGYANAVRAGDLDDPAIPADIRALAVLADMITLRAHRVGADGLDRVRAHGWDPSRALEAVWVAYLFNAIVRLSVIVPIAG